MTDRRAGPTQVRRKMVAVGRRGRDRLRKRSPLSRFFRPAVSIVLPVYNVEQYVAECLDSIAAQTMDDYEVIAVDDGSTDGSRRIVERYAAEDRRIRVVVRENGGLGAARNTGVSQARGRFLTFVDSDDLLPPHALAALTASALRSGSDIVVGSVQRFDSARQWRPTWTPKVHGRLRTGIRCEEFLPVLRNLYTWNKLFRREFFLAQGLRFREGVAYEDQPIITQLLSRATAIDVIPDVVYHYRARDDLSSISQQTASLGDLEARILAWRTSREVLRRETTQELYDGWLLTLFDAHFHWYVNSPGTSDDAYWATLRDAVLELTDEAPDHVWAATPPAKRVALELVRQDRRADAQEFVRVEAGKPESWPSRVRPDGVLLELPFLDDPDLDEELFLLRPEQLELAHSVENVHWVDEEDARAVLHMSGWAYIAKVDLAEHDSKVAVLLRHPDGSEDRFESSSRPPPAFPPPFDDAWCDYSAGTFQVELPLHEVLARPGSEQGVDVLLEVSSAGFTVVDRVVVLVRSGSAGVIPAADLGNGDRVVADWMFERPLRFRRAPLQVEAVQVSLDDRTLSGRLAGPLLGELDGVVVSCAGASGQARLVHGPGDGATFSLVLPPAPRREGHEASAWVLGARTLDGRTVDITHRGTMGDLQAVDTPTGTLVLERKRLALGLTEWSWGAVADSVEITDDGVLHLSGRVFGPEVTTVTPVTRHKNREATGPAVEVSDGRFEAALPLASDLYRFGPMPLQIGDHEVHALLTVGAEDSQVEVPVKMSPRLNAELPVAVRTAHLEGRLVRGPEAGVRLVLVRPIGKARGRYQQNRLRRRPVSGRTHRGVLMRAYFGESATDNGVSIQRELRRRGSDLPVYWAVQDHSIPVPPGGTPVVVNTEDYYDLLSSVKYYIDNMYQPEFHVKPEGQVIVQTFHGYPFKQMGHAHWRNLQFPNARIASYDRRAKDWDYLVSPARYATPLLVEAFAYPGEVLEIGYPRNDVLLGPDAEEIRRATRRSLGIEDGQTAVLVAPTFRDYLSRDDKTAVMTDFFDYAAAHEALGDDFVYLVRGHAFNARVSRRVGRLPGVVEVTGYPEVSDLYLAADAAVVDYSSLRFDFGVTGKPMIFHVPDMQRYIETRGWLFDFEPTAPGPLVSTTAEVVEQLRDLPGLRERHREQYAAFRSDYLDLEDGQAGRRFVDRVFVPRGDADLG